MIWAAATIGCDAPAASESQAAPQRAVSLGTGVLRGTVTFAGPVPEMKVSEVPCHDGMMTVADESVVINDSGTLRNVFVYLEDAGSTGDGSAKEPAVLDQVDCRYVPHAIGVQVGQALTVRSSDPTLHNVHSLSRRNRPFNFGMTTAGAERDVKFTSAEFVPLRCDVHPWMSAYVGVFENPWFDVTRESGSFEITQVPNGSYKLVTWHERYGRLEQEVNVTDDQPVTAAFEYKAP